MPDAVFYALWLYGLWCLSLLDWRNAFGVDAAPKTVDGGM